MQFIGVSWKDEPDTMRDFVDQYGLGAFPHLEDDGTVFAEFGMVSQPGWAFINDDGTTTTTLGALGPEGLAQELEALIQS